MTTVLGVAATSDFTAGLGLFYRAFQPLSTSAPAGPHPCCRAPTAPARLARVFVEVFGHTHFKARPFVNAAHWAVMVGFLFGAIVWFESYIHTFAPHSGWPLLK